MGTESEDGINKLDGFNTPTETVLGVLATYADRVLSNLPNAPNVSTVWGGVLSKANTGLTMGLEGAEVAAAAFDGDPSTRVDQQLAGAVVSTAVPAAAAWAAGAAIGSIGGPIGAAIGAAAGYISGAYASLTAEGYVESFFEEQTETAKLRDTVAARKAELEDLASRVEMILDSPSHTEDLDSLIDMLKSIYDAYGITARPDLSGGPTGMGNDPLDPRGFDQLPGYSRAGGSLVGGTSPTSPSASGISYGTGSREYGGGGRDAGGPDDNTGDGGTNFGSDTRSGGTGYVGDHPGPGAPNGNVGSPSGQAANSRSSGAKDWGGARDLDKTGAQPILLDLDGNGIEPTELSQSTVFMDATGDGRDHRTAWAGAGDGVLFIDVDGDGKISNSHEYVFTEWVNGATDDLDALRRAFDSNGDGKLTQADARWGQFKVMATNPDGTMEAKTLSQLGITEINLTANATQRLFSDGSAITGEAKFIINGQARTVANTRLVAESEGYRVEETLSVAANGTRTVTQTGYDSQDDCVFIYKSATSSNGRSINNSYDFDGDGVYERFQTIRILVDADGARTETVTNSHGADAASAILTDRTQTVTSADGREVTVYRDSAGGGWFDEQETRVSGATGNQIVTISQLAENGDVISFVTEVQSDAGMTRTTRENIDGVGAADRVTTRAITTAESGARTEEINVTSRDGSLLSGESLTISANGLVRKRVVDQNGDGLVDSRVREQTSQVSGETITLNTTRTRDMSLVSEVEATVSADGLVRTTESALYGANGVLAVSTETTSTTIISATGARSQTIDVRNADGSVNGLTKTWLGADKTSFKAWVDLDQDGVLSGDELVKQVTVDAATEDSTTVLYDRAANGTVLSKQIIVTTEVKTDDYRRETVATETDRENDGDVDLREVVTTTTNSSGATAITNLSSEDGTRISRTNVTTTADGLTTTVRSDTGGNDAWELVEIRQRSEVAGGAVTQDIERFAGNETTLLFRETTVTGSRRLVTTVTTDSNGDGTNDKILRMEKRADGSDLTNERNYFADGSLASRTEVAVSANGLVRETSEFLGASSIALSTTEDVSAYLTDGALSRTVSVKNDDGTLRSATQTVVSGNGQVTTTRTNADGSNGWEATTVSTRSVLANGEVRTVVENLDHDGDRVSASK
jgi:hypothetical protein